MGSRPAFVSRARASVAPRPPLAARAALCRGARSRWAQPQHGRYRLGAHGALSAEPAGDLGECALLPASLLVHRLLSRPPAVATDPTRPGSGQSQDSGVQQVYLARVGVRAWGSGGFALPMSRRSGFRTPRHSRPGAESGYTCSRRGAGLRVHKRIGSEWSPRSRWLD